MTDSRLLIVDDDVEICKYVSSVAKICGYAVQDVTDADAFRTWFDDWHPSHIMLDLQMPDCDGIELLRFLANRKCRARVVVMSGVDLKIIESARHMGVGSGLDIAAMVQKPIRARDLQNVLQEIKGGIDIIDKAAILAAIANREFRLVYQPKVALNPAPPRGSRLRTVGFEGLLRWQHPRRGLLPPSEFLPLAETLAVMDDLTEMVIDLALQQLRDWHDKGLVTAIACNVSAVNLKAADFADRLVQRCRQVSISPEALTIELTETAAMADPVKAMDILTRLRLKGFHLSIDDFGTGYSSLIQLQRLPFSELKIDRALISDTTSSEQSRMIVKTAIDLAHNLGLIACAEGIETAACLDAVQALGCDLAQGYHISRPLGADQAEAWLRQA